MFCRRQSEIIWFLRGCFQDIREEALYLGNSRCLWAGKFSPHNKFCLRGIKNYVILPALTRRVFLVRSPAQPPEARHLYETKEGLNG